MEILILGCGFTGQRVARRFLAQGAAVTVTTRDPRKLEDVGAKVIRLEDVAAHVRPGVMVLHSLPPEVSNAALDLLGNAPSRVVYLSSTAVYGAAAVVDENTPPDWTSPRAQARSWSSGALPKGHGLR